jgi:BirA family biotin operon repressor/biotin-[acetyl-CoA-carboxylase] ligase
MNITEANFHRQKQYISLEEMTFYQYFLLWNLLSKTNPPEGTCVYTAYQSAGRGQIGRFWHSSKNKNIYSFHIYFYPKPLTKLSDQFILEYHQWACCKRCSIRMYCDNVKIKWPNDIYVDDKKIAGILVQNILRGTDIKATVIVSV